MKRSICFAAFAVAIAAFACLDYLGAYPSAPPVLNGFYLTLPWDGGSHAEAAFQALAGTTIPMSSYSFASTKDNSTRTGTIVGTSPFVTPLAGTSINAVIIPLKITIGSTVFDPTASNSCDLGISALSRFQNSPLVAAVPNLTIGGVNVGNSQFINGFRRAEFWTKINGSSSYQNPINYTTAATVSLSAGTHGTTYNGGSTCKLLGIVSNSWLDGQLKTLMASLRSSGVLSTTQFAIFLLRDVVQSSVDPPNTSNCCILGYHGATGNPVQTYSPMDWDTTGLFGSGTADGSVSAHEIGEWMDDPLGTNGTPKWGNIGQVSGCQGNLEVGDPLSGKLMPAITMNGKAYHMQELAYFSWFFNKLGTASLGGGGKFSSNGTFTGPSKVCPSGGTY